MFRKQTYVSFLHQSKNAAATTVGCIFLVFKSSADWLNSYQEEVNFQLVLK